MPTNTNTLSGLDGFNEILDPNSNSVLENQEIDNLYLDIEQLLSDSLNCSKPEKPAAAEFIGANSKSAVHENYKGHSPIKKGTDNTFESSLDHILFKFVENDSSSKRARTNESPSLIKSIANSNVLKIKKNLNGSKFAQINENIMNQSSAYAVKKTRKKSVVNFKPHEVPLQRKRKFEGDNAIRTVGLGNMNFGQNIVKLVPSKILKVGNDSSKLTINSCSNESLVDDNLSKDLNFGDQDIFNFFTDEADLIHSEPMTKGEWDDLFSGLKDPVDTDPDRNGQYLAMGDSNILSEPNNFQEMLASENSAYLNSDANQCYVESPLSTVQVYDSNEENIDPSTSQMVLRSNPKLVKIKKKRTMDDLDNLFYTFLNGLHCKTVPDEGPEEIQDEDYDENKEVKDDFEEFRNDKEVKVSTKEYLEILDENMAPAEIYQDENYLPAEIEEACLTEAKAQCIFPFPFSISQLLQLKSQLLNHFQLILQVQCLTTHIKESTFISKTTTKFINELYSLRKHFLENRALENTLTTPLQHEKNISSLLAFFDDRSFNPENARHVLGDIKTFPNEGIDKDQILHKFRELHMDTPLLDIEGLDNVFASFSFINLHLEVSNPISYILESRSDLFSQSFQPEQISWKISLHEKDKLLKLHPEAETKIAQVLNSAFDDSLSVQIIPNVLVRCKFYPSEDNLLLYGLRRYGTSDWNSINLRYLPTKSEKQISTRYKNLTSRRAAENPVKDFYFKRFKELTPEEEDKLFWAAYQCEFQFDLVAKDFFPHLPVFVLKKLFIHIYNKKIGKGSSIRTPTSRSPPEKSKWNRDHDKLILKKVNSGNLQTIFKDLSLVLNRPPFEIEARYRYLLFLYSAQGTADIK